MKMTKLSLPFAVFLLMGSNAFAAKTISLESIQAISGVIEGAKAQQENIQALGGVVQNVKNQYAQNSQAPVRNASQDVKTPGLCPEHYPLGIPMVLTVEKEKVARRSFYLCRTGYAVQFDPATKTPLWVAEKLTSQQLGAEKEDRTDDFRQDPDVPGPAQASLNDYKGSKFDRGHMAPAADMIGRSGNAMSESFYLTNMIPQVGPNQNRGIWADLEGTVRQWSKARGEILVVTGPIFSEGTIAIGNSKVWVPTHLYKVVLDPKTFESIAFIIPNRQIVTRKTRNLDKGNPQSPQTTEAQAINCGSVCSIENFMVPVVNVEKATGIRFFSRVNDKDYGTITQKVMGNWKMR